MSQQTLGQARVVDPILSDIARGYKQADLVARTLFPFVPVGAYGGQVLEFGKEAFRLYNSRRAPGTATKRVQFGYAGKPYAIVPSSLEAVVPRELQRDASQVPKIDLAQRSVNTVLKVVNLEHEYNCAQIARNAANYDAGHKVALAGAARWTSDTSDPVSDTETGREAIRGSIGMYPNSAVISARAFKALKTNPSILDRIKYTGGNATPAKVTLQAIADLFEIPNLVMGAAMVATGQNDDFGDVWGNDFVMAYSNVSGTPSAEEPGFAYTYLIEGMPAVEQPYFDNNTKSWVYPVSFDNTPVLSGMSAGYFIQDAGA
ncbi:MAG: major capsid protein [Dokdonella sp.]